MENPTEKFEKTKETREVLIKKVTDIIRSGKYVVKGFGPDKGQVFMGKEAKILENGMISVVYTKNEKNNTPGTINTTFPSIEEFLDWQKLNVLIDL